MNLCNLAPDLQEELLYLKPYFNGRAPITERQIRPIAAEPNWDKQRRRFKKLLDSASHQHVREFDDRDCKKKRSKHDSVFRPDSH